MAQTGFTWVRFRYIRHRPNVTFDPFDGRRCNGRVNTIRTIPRTYLIAERVNLPAISSRVLQWVCPDALPDRFPSMDPLKPLRRRARARMCG